LLHWLTEFGVPWKSLALAWAKGTYYAGSIDNKETQYYMPEDLGNMRACFYGMLLVMLWFLMHYRWQKMPRGFWTFTMAAHVSIVTPFLYKEPWLMIPGVLVGVVLDVLTRQRINAQTKKAVRYFSVLIPLLVQALTILTIYIVEGIRWSPLLLGGSVVFV